MKKLTLFIALSLINISIIFAQATDFTTDDCNGITHNLFDSLDAGNVIVISWVMPCGPCATYTIPAYAAVQSFSTSHPGRVHFYLVDDYANTQCPTLVNWGNSNNLPLNTAFSSSDISMSDYGTNGMPKVVVLGGSDHTVFYNQNDSHITFNGAQTAISDALSAPLAVSDHQNSKFGLISFPNPTQNGKLNVSYRINNNGPINVEIINILGETVLALEDQIPNIIGQYNNTFDISELTKGTYFLKLSTLSYTEISRFVVAQ
mgnify:FL=1